MPRVSQAAGLITVVFIFFFSLIFMSALASAGEKSTRIIVIETMPVPVVLEHSRWFKQGLAELGYRPGENLDLVVLKAEGDRERAVRLLKDALAAGKPDIVVTFATLASQAAYQVLGGQDVPIVFSVVSDPVGAGLIKEVGRPSGTNITGRVFTLFREIKIDMSMRLIGQIKKDGPVRFGCVHSSYPSARGDIKALKRIAESKGDVEFAAYEVQYREMPHGLEAMLRDVEKGIKELEDRIDFWWQPSGPLAEVKPYTELFLKNSGRPIGYGNTLMSVEMGALLTLNPDFEEGGREAARLVQAVLEGTAAAGIPVTAPENFNLGLNLGTALKLGLVVPSDMLELAGPHLYR